MNRLTTVHYRGKLTGVLVIEIPLTGVELVARKAAGHPRVSLFVLVLPGSLCSLTTHAAPSDALNALRLLENEALEEKLDSTRPLMKARWLRKRGWDKIESLPKQNELEKAAFAELFGGYGPSLGAEVAPQPPEAAPGASTRKLD